MLRRAQVLVDVNNQSVVGAFNRGRAKNRETHALLVQLFALQVEHGFILLLMLVPTAENGVADAIWRPSRDAIIRIAPAAFGVLWDEMGPLIIDLVACAASVLRFPVERGGTAILLPVRRRRLGGNGCVGAGCVDRTGHYSPGLRLLFPAPGHGGSHCAIPDGMQSSCGRPPTSCKSVLVYCGAVRRSKVDHGGSDGSVRVLSVAQPQGWPSEVEVPALEVGRVRGRLPR